MMRLKISQFLVACAVVAFSSANLFANAAWLQGTGSGDLGGSLGTGQLMIDASYDNLEQYSANSPNSPLNASVLPNYLDLSVSAPVNVEFGTTQNQNGMDIGSDFIFTLKDAVPAGGNFMVTFEFDSPIGPSLASDPSGVGSRFSFAPRYEKNGSGISPGASAGDTITIEGMHANMSAVDFSPYSYVASNFEGFSDYIGGTDGSFTGTTQAVFANASNDNPDFGVAFIDRTQETPDAHYSKMKVTYTADPAGSGFMAGQRFRITVDGAPVPEPATGLLVLLGAIPGLMMLRRRK